MLWPNRLDDLTWHCGRLDAQIFLLILLTSCPFQQLCNSTTTQELHIQEASVCSLTYLLLRDQLLIGRWKRTFILLSSVILKFAVQFLLNRLFSVYYLQASCYLRGMSGDSEVRFQDRQQKENNAHQEQISLWKEQTKSLFWNAVMEQRILVIPTMRKKNKKSCLQLKKSGSTFKLTSHWEKYRSCESKKSQECHWMIAFIETKT